MTGNDDGSDGTRRLRGKIQTRVDTFWVAVEWNMRPDRETDLSAYSGLQKNRRWNGHHSKVKLCKNRLSAKRKHCILSESANLNHIALSSPNSSLLAFTQTILFSFFIPLSVHHFPLSWFLLIFLSLLFFFLLYSTWEIFATYSTVTKIRYKMALWISYSSRYFTLWSAFLNCWDTKKRWPWFFLKS